MGGVFAMDSKFVCLPLSSMLDLFSFREPAVRACEMSMPYSNTFQDPVLICKSF